jgi:hypothetical protein
MPKYSLLEALRAKTVELNKYQFSIVGTLNRKSKKSPFSVSG